MNLVQRLQKLGLPLLAKELIEQAARKRTYVVRVLYAALLFFVAFLAFYETLSAGLDPYPRKQGETFDDMLAAPKGAVVAKENPFAVLANLKPKA